VNEFIYIFLGVLPRPEGKWENKPLPMPRVDPVKRDNWTKKKALFGQNDYIGRFGLEFIDIVLGVNKFIF